MSRPAQSSFDPASGFTPPRLNHVLLPLVAALLIAVGTIVALLLHAAGALNDAARADRKDRVAVALEIEASRLEDLIVEYSYWDAAHEKLVIAPERDWADENVGSYMTDNQNIAFSVAVSGRDQVTMGFVDGEVAPIDLPALRQAGLDALVAAAREADKPPTEAFSTYLMFQGMPHLVAVNTFAPEIEGTRPLDGAYLILGKRIDAAYATRFGERYRIPGLRLVPVAETTTPVSLTLRDGADAPLLTLAWHDPALTTHLDRSLYVMLIAAVLAILLLLGSIARGHLRAQRRYVAYLDRLAHHDPLTGIGNRRAFDDESLQEFARARRRGRPLSLLMLDLDHFKSVNDRWGHVVGDQVLIAAVVAMRESVRPFDFLARVGGEEFAVLLPDSDRAVALEVAERLRAAVRAVRVAAIPDDPGITISAGVAELAAGEDFAALLARADAALYAAKDAGRDRVVSA